MCARLLATGVTAICPTLVSSSADTYAAVVATFRKLMARLETANAACVRAGKTGGTGSGAGAAAAAAAAAASASATAGAPRGGGAAGDVTSGSTYAGLGPGARIIGLHLEGPFIHPDRSGAHARHNLRQPAGVPLCEEATAAAEAAKEVAATTGGLDALSRIYGGIAWHAGEARVVTLAPELAGSLEAIEALAGAGVVASVGHTTADIRCADGAVERGASLITHLFNAMSAFHHRDPGVVGLLGRMPGGAGVTSRARRRHSSSLAAMGAGGQGAAASAALMAGLSPTAAAAAAVAAAAAAAASRSRTSPDTGNAGSPPQGDAPVMRRIRAGGAMEQGGTGQSTPSGGEGGAGGGTPRLAAAAATPGASIREHEDGAPGSPLAAGHGGGAGAAGDVRSTAARAHAHALAMASVGSTPALAGGVGGGGGGNTHSPVTAAAARLSLVEHVTPFTPVPFRTPVLPGAADGRGAASMLRIRGGAAGGGGGGPATVLDFMASPGGNGSGGAPAAATATATASLPAPGSQPFLRSYSASLDLDRTWGAPGSSVTGMVTDGYEGGGGGAGGAAGGGGGVDGQVSASTPRPTSNLALTRIPADSLGAVSAAPAAKGGSATPDNAAAAAAVYGYRPPVAASTSRPHGHTGGGNAATSVHERPFYSLIVDGVHVHPYAVNIAYETHPAGLILVTDAMKAMGLPVGRHMLGELGGGVVW